MTPFGPLPWMPGGPPWDSVEAINAVTWDQQQQHMAAYAAQQAQAVVQAQAAHVQQANLNVSFLLLQGS